MTANFLDLFERFNPLAVGPLALAPLGKLSAETYAARSTRVAGAVQDGCRRLLDGVTAGIGETTHLAGEFAKVRSPADFVAVQREWATVTQARVVNQVQTVLDVSSRIAAELSVIPAAASAPKAESPAPKAAPVAAPIPVPAPKAEAPKVEVKVEPVKVEPVKAEPAPAPVAKKAPAPRKAPAKTTAPKAESPAPKAEAAKPVPVKAETPKVEAAPAPAPKAEEKKPEAPKAEASKTEAPKGEVKAEVKAAAPAAE